VNRAVLRERLVALLADQDGPLLAETLMGLGVPCAPVLSVSAALKHPHTAHRGMVVGIGEHYRGLASPVKLSRTPASYRLVPPAESDGD
jgi:crotonobetainyl-CoA:carnitine CoA-transferase CaiB-like acyl-CoA transferase